MATKSGRLLWMHSDSTGDMHARAVAAFAKAKAGAWGTTPADRAEFRAWLCSICGVIADLGPTPTAEVEPAARFLQPDAPGGDRTVDGYPAWNGKEIIVEIRQSSRVDNANWQRTLAQCVNALAFGSNPEVPLPENTRSTRITRDDQGVTSRIRTEQGETAQIGVLEALVIVAVAGILAAAIVSIIGMGAEATTSVLATSSKEREMVSAMTTAAEVIENHQRAEQAKGASLPYSDEELRLLETLRGSIREITKREPPPLLTVPNIGAVTKAGADAIESVGGGLGIALPLILALWALSD